MDVILVEQLHALIDRAGAIGNVTYAKNDLRFHLRQCFYSQGEKVILTVNVPNESNLQIAFLLAVPCHLFLFW